MGKKVIHQLVIAACLLAAGCSADSDSTPPDAASSIVDHGPAPDGPVALDGSSPDSSPAVDAKAPYTHESVTVQKVYQWSTSGKVMTLLDVREPGEYSDGHIANSINKPWNSGVLQKQLKQLPTDRPLVLYCRSGARSNNAATLLAKQGFSPVYDMTGGILVWTAASLPVKK